MIKSKVSAQYRNIGLWIIRVGLGLMFIFHGYPKLAGGPEMWEQVGLATHGVGIHFLPVVFGFLAAITEFFGGICLILGLFFRPVLVFMLIEMIVAAASHLTAGASFAIFSHPIEVGIIFFGLLFIGPDKYAADRRLKKRRRHW